MYKTCQSGNLLLLFDSCNQATAAINNVGRNFSFYLGFQIFSQLISVQLQATTFEITHRFKITKDKQFEDARVSITAEWGVLGQQQMTGTEFHDTLGRQNEEEDSGRGQLIVQKLSFLDCLRLLYLKA
jgi:hypothetical protein